MAILETLQEVTGKIITRIFGNPSEKVLKAISPNLDVVRAWEPIFERYTDSRLKFQTYLFRQEIAKIREHNPKADESGAVEDYLNRIMPQAFAICREAAKRTLGVRHYDVQLIGGMVLHKGMIAEMITGEGKTLVATLASFLNALARKGKYVSYKPLMDELSKLSEENPTEYQRRVRDEGLWPTRLIPSMVVDPSRPDDPLVFVGTEPSVVHVVTVNDYLARRDADWNRPLFTMLGITVGTIQSGMMSVERHHEYKCDITYGTNSEFGFDYLRDNMKMSLEDQVQKRRHLAIVDEVDSILIDEARTPLIISGGPDHEVTEKYFIAAELADHLKPVPEEEVEKKIQLSLQGQHDYEPKVGHYIVDEKDHAVTLTARGIEEVERFLVKRGILKPGENYFHPKHMDWPHYIDNALKAKELYKKEDEYVVAEDRDGRIGVIIVDEFTGRKMYGRRWSDGLHQAVEAKEIRRNEPIELEGETQTLATITLQNFFLLFDKISGMTGTAATESAEFGKVYKLEVVVIPTNRPLRRVNHPDQIYGSVPEKYKGIVSEIEWVHKIGRPILVGTTSVEKSELLAGMLERTGLRNQFNVLNAKQHEREAMIVEKAGELGAITVATNMAGRGTDIKLGRFTQEELVEYWKKTGFAPKNLDLSWGQDAVKQALVKHWAELVLTDKNGKPLSKSDIKNMAYDLLNKKVEAQFKQAGMLMPSICMSVAELGGLHIIGTERHEARRIDNQLRGRAGRQGDPGGNRFFLSLDDDLMRLFAKDWVKNFLRRTGLSGGQAIESRMVSNAIEKAQRRVEEHNFAIRRRLLEYDEVLNNQRTWIYDLRQRTLGAMDLRDISIEWLQTVCANAVERYMSEGFPGVGEITMIIDNRMNRYAPLTDLDDDLAIPDEDSEFNETGKLQRDSSSPAIDYDALISALNRHYEIHLSADDYRDMSRDQLRDTLIETIVTYYDGKDETLYKVTRLAEWAETKFGISVAPETILFDDPQEIYDALYGIVMDTYEKREKEFGDIIRTDPETGQEIERFPRMRKLERYLMLDIMDKKWKDHLLNMDQLKSGIYLRSFAQKDPKEEYKREGGVIFQEMLESMLDEYTDLLLRVQLTEEVEDQAVVSVWQENEQQAQHEDAGSIFDGRDAQNRAAELGGESVMPVATIRKANLPQIKPNDICPCGSGKKYKKCHGRPGSPPLTPNQIQKWQKEKMLARSKMGG